MDSQPVQKAFAAGFGGVSYPVLSDFHPKGEVAKAYGIYNEERGTGRRAVFIVDKEGVVRFKKIYEGGGTPDPKDILAELDKLGLK